VWQRKKERKNIFEITQKEGRRGRGRKKRKKVVQLTWNSVTSCVVVDLSAVLSHSILVRQHKVHA